jgi:protein-disulfide isomerase
MRSTLRFRSTSLGIPALVLWPALILLFSLTACRHKNELAALSPEQSRRIEILIRSQYDIPADYQLVFSQRARGQFPGYYDLPVTFSHDGKQVKFTFLLSQDAKHLARLQEFDLTKDPSSAIPFNSQRARGEPQGKVTIVVFDDLECPFCARSHAALFPDTLQRYKKGVTVVYKDFPLVEIHPWAMHAAINAGCLAEQNTPAYWDYLDKVHAHYADFSGDKQRLPATLQKLDQLAAQEAGVDQKTLDLCIKKQDESAIRASMAEGQKLGVESTPTIFVNGERIVGARPINWVWASIDRALKVQGLEPPAQIDLVRTENLQNRAQDTLK